MVQETTVIIKKESEDTNEKFIKKMVRKGVDEKKVREAMAEIGKFKGIAKRKISEEEYERIRKEAFEELERERGWTI